MGRPTNASKLAGLSSESDPSVAVENSAEIENVGTEQLPQMSNLQLLTIIAAMQKQLVDSNAATAKLAAAITDLATPKAPIKSRKQEADEENERLFQKRQTDLERMKKANDSYNHQICEHIAGSNKIGEGFKDLQGRTSFQWHRNDVGVEFAVCSICQRILLPTDPDYLEWKRKPQFGKPSAAGQRTVMNYSKAMEDSFLHDS